MSKDFEHHYLWQPTYGPWIRYELDDPALLSLPPPKPDNRFDCIPPEELFAAGVTPECYLCWQTTEQRELIQSCLKNHPDLGLAAALPHLVGTDDMSEIPREGFRAGIVWAGFAPRGKAGVCDG